MPTRNQQLFLTAQCDRRAVHKYLKRGFEGTDRHASNLRVQTVTLANSCQPQALFKYMDN